MNKIMLIGRTTKEIELQNTESGIPVCNFSLAVRRKYPNSDGSYETDFFNCRAWRGAAEAIARYVKKGDKMFIAGNIQFRNYEDKNGVKRRIEDVSVEEFEFLEGKKDNESGEEKSNVRSTVKKKPTL